MSETPTIWFAFHPSPLGDLLLAADGTALAGAWFVDQKYAPPADPTARPGWRPGADAAPLAQAMAEFDAYFAGRLRRFEVRCRPAGTPFQRRVWDALRRLDYGTTTSYGALAARLGAHPRPVGAAVGRNPLAIVVPCHRVLGTDGSLTGYAGGLDRKIALLALESGRPPAGGDNSYAIHKIRGAGDPS